MPGIIIISIFFGYSFFTLRISSSPPCMFTIDFFTSVVAPIPSFTFHVGWTLMILESMFYCFLPVSTYTCCIQLLLILRVCLSTICCTTRAVLLAIVSFRYNILCVLCKVYIIIKYCDYSDSKWNPIVDIQILQYNIVRNCCHELYRIYFGIIICT